MPIPAPPTPDRIQRIQPIHPTPKPHPRAVSLPSITLGLLAVLFICALTPFNDYVLGNTFFVGNYLPVGLLLFFVAVVLLINAPLSRFLPRFAFTPGQLAVALSMALVACTFPSSGLMRYLPAGIVGMHVKASSNSDYLAVVKNSHLPDWLLPDFESKDPVQRLNDPVIMDYYIRANVDDDSFRTRFHAVPWRAWVRPFFAWGAFLFSLYGAILCLSIIVRRQWTENERLPFPLASVYASLIEQPEPGRWLNRLFGSRGFWLAATAVFLVRLLNGLHDYAPARFPKISLGYDFKSIFTTDPWRFTEDSFKAAYIYFAVIGLSFFLQTKVAFSLWFFYLFFQAERMSYGVYQADFTTQMRYDHTFGALVVFAGMVLWIGRHHWLIILRQMIRGPRPGEPRGRYAPYSLVGWTLVACIAAMLVFLTLAGMTLGGAALLVLMILLLCMTAARVVAETGLPFLQIPVTLYRPWFYLLSAFPFSIRTPFANYFYGTFFHHTLTHDLRESLSVYSTHALRTADATAYADEQRPSRGLPFVACLILALLVGYTVSWASTLYTEYSYGATLAANSTSPINSWGVDVGPVENILKPARDYLLNPRGPREGHNPLSYLGFGAAITAVMAFFRLRFLNFPFHPVGFLLCYSYPIGMMWLSIFIGWLAKVVVVRFGGIDLYRKARSFFIGLILGDILAAAFWLITSMILQATGHTYYRLLFLPT